ncbi:hypothetical protein Y032_0194g1450 [Ancylostoma ceylanicum]|uniref:TIL domain-containing protein n=1 Tax=Ancylostoma ceylanicum TaxID=53326 RepID=A0A016SQ56_9BILA|nr:hypothetical protein Y032_0194g1450 [Ancylostoma ceylanicum]
MKLLLLLISAGIGIHCLPFKRCGENEELKRYGDYCFPTCANPHPAIILSITPKRIQKECLLILLRNVCRCKPGFMYDSRGKCTNDCSSDRGNAPMNTEEFQNEHGRIPFESED